MPIYEYVCENCQTRHERIVMTRNAKPECPKCGSKKQLIQFSVFAAPNSNGASNSSSASATSSGSCGCTPRTCGCH